MVAAATGVALVATLRAGPALAQPGAGPSSTDRTAAAAPGTNPSGTVRALYTAAGFQELIDRVTAQVHATYPGARLGFVDGRSPSGPTTHLRDVTQWGFLYLTVVDRHPVVVTAAVQLPSWTATITAVRSPVFGLHVDQPVTMSPFEAARLAWTAGYRTPYDEVWLHQPGDLDARYSFFSGSDAVSVDTVTREVTPRL